MDWLIKLGWMLFGCFAGIFAAGFLFAQCLVILVFGIPTAFSLKATRLLTSWRPLTNYLIFLLLLSTLACGGTWAIYTYPPRRAFWAYQSAAELDFGRSSGGYAAIVTTAH